MFFDSGLLAKKKTQHITSHHILAPNPIQTNAIMSWVATPRAVARVRAAICLPGGTNQKNVRYGFGLGGVCEAAAVRARKGLAVGAARRGRHYGAEGGATGA